MRRKVVLSLIALLVLGAQVAEAAVLRIAVVETSDVAGYVKAIKAAEADLQKKGSPIKVRVWRALFAGDQAGSIVVSAEYPSLAALAADRERAGGEAAFRATFLRIDQIGKVVSDSIYTDISGVK